MQQKLELEILIHLNKLVTVEMIKEDCSSKYKMLLNRRKHLISNDPKKYHI